MIRSTAEGTGNYSGATAAVDVVVSTADLSLGMVNNSSPVVPGAALSYTLRFGNPGGTSPAATVLAVPLPPGTSFVSASDGGTLASGVVQWNVGGIAAGASGQRTLVVQVDPQAANGSVVTATADLRDATTGRSLARANAAAAVLTSSATQMTLTATPDPARPGQLVQYAATVTNRAANTQYYTITALVPNGTTVAASAISQNVYAACSGATVCGPGSVILWGGGGHPAVVGAGQSVTVTFAALVDAANPLPNGTVIRSTAEGTGNYSGATAAVDVVIGP